jgi:hypothetical protein
MSQTSEGISNCIGSIKMYQIACSHRNGKIRAADGLNRESPVQRLHGGESVIPFIGKKMKNV